VGGGSKGSSEQQQAPGTLSPITASLLSLFGGGVGVKGGQFVPTEFGGQGGVFHPEMFAALPGLLQNQPLTNVESFLLGTGPPTGGGGQTPQFDRAGYEAALSAYGRPVGVVHPAGGKGGGPQGTGPEPDPSQFISYGEGDPNATVFGARGGFQDLALASALQGQSLLGRTAESLTLEPTAAIAQARRSFEQEAIPSILERAPGFSSSDVQRELFRAGADVETQVGALRDAHQLALAQTVPQFAEALGTNLLTRATDILGFGSLGREFVRETGPAGDAFRTLTALQSLTGPGFTTFGTGSSKSKSTQVL